MSLGHADSEQMYRILLDNPGGISQQDFTRTTGWAPQRTMNAGNLLLSQSRLEAIQLKDGLLFKPGPGAAAPSRAAAARPADVLVERFDTEPYSDFSAK